MRGTTLEPAAKTLALAGAYETMSDGESGGAGATGARERASYNRRPGIESRASGSTTVPTQLEALAHMRSIASRRTTSIVYRYR